MDGLEHASLHSDCWSVDKQSFSLQQDHALSVQKYYTHNWAFQFLLLRRGMMELLQSWKIPHFCIAPTCISSPWLLFLFPRSNTNSGLSSSCRLGFRREGEQSLSMQTSLWLCATTSPLSSALKACKTCCALSFFPFQYHFISFTAPAASIRGFDGNLPILFWMWCLLSRLCSCLTCFILCKKADVL